MLHTLWLLLSTIALRPYVFVFLAFYLAIAITHMGWKRTAVYTVLAYLLAWLSEWSSAVADIGIPFGIYKYINTTADRELWVAGVPFMDSLSFSFLSYLSWEVAILLLGELPISRRNVQIVNRDAIRHGWPVTLLAAFLMTYLDIVIDPLTIQGEKWFLGKLYYYPDGGIYFGITLANFAGWFLLCAAILHLYGWLERTLLAHWGWEGVRAYPFKALGAVGLYFGVLGFNLFMTVWIGDLRLAMVDCFLVLPLLVMLALAVRRSSYAPPVLP
ncbi:MAG: carotenoid biosynthesis protein [Acidobacteria bacterium]|nr:carotenoid biosynthesis protein [Acidobacteriota bacterium]MBI3424655.1 carotenoid biosynthesis protein [Acidobacteriota bacterium]